MVNCRICGSQLEFLENIKNVPLDASALLRIPSEPIDIVIDLYKCQICGHYQINNRNENNAERLGNIPKNLLSLIEDRKRSFSYLLSIIQGHNRILEVGCGFGIIFEMAKKYFKKVISVDPSKKIVEKIQEDNFDAFYALQIFEHIDNPLEIMKDAYNILNFGGIGWIEVPNGLTIMNEVQYYSIFANHINYFTPHSLSTLVELSGFQTIMVRPSLGKDHLEIFFKKPVKNISMNTKRELQCKRILNEISKYSNVVIWGAGGKSHVLFGYLYEELKISHIVDSNIDSQGLYIPGASVCIEAPAKSIFLNVDLVVIFSVSYKDEIIKILRNEYAYNGNIFCVSSEDSIV